MQLPIVQDVFHIDDIPSIVEFEDALRSTNADKATGLDPIPSGIFRQHAPHLASAYFPLLLKMCFWQHEPVASKGGQIAVIYKKGSGLQAADYRGIMLLPSVAKRVHALLRSRLIKLLSRVRPQGQLGGFPAMQAPFGSQILQTFGRLMDTIDISSAVVFIDLSNAFHRLIRELVSGIVVPADIEDVLERLMHENFPLHAMLELLQMPCLLQSLGAPPFLIQLIQDLHTGTWMYAPGMRQPIVTKKGTRPGSPLADCIFHVLMTSMASDLNQVIADNSEFQRILARVDLHAESIIWADDIAVPVATEKADSLPGAIEHILHAVHEIFAKRGFSLNFRKGKTSVVATFRGSRAPLMRAKYQLCTRPGMEVRFGQSTEFIHFPAVYKHLGTIFSSAHTLDQEIATRIGMARGAFAQVAGPVLCNRRLPEPSRIKLFRALIESRLFFGMGAWPTPTARQMAKIHAALLAMLRKLFRLSHDEVSQTSSAALFHRAGICSPRARLALDRLRYAQSVWMNGPEMLQHSLHREEALRPDSWLLGLKHDLAWLRDLVQDDCPFFQAMRSELDPAKLDLTEIFDLWQADADAWKLCLKRAWKRFCFQENMTHDLLHMNKQFFRILEDAGASFDPSYQDVLTPSCQTFPCHCGRQFTTAQGLATHQRKAHQIFSIEHDLLEGTTCPECLRHFWSKLRLYQHLSYIPRRTGINSCYQALRQRGFKASQEVGDFQQLPKEVRGLGRVEALQALGPLQPLPQTGHDEYQHIQLELQRLHDELQFSHQPDDPGVTRTQLRDFLTATTEEWFQLFCQENFDEELSSQLPDRWLAVIFHLEPGLDDWIEHELMAWGQECLPTITDSFIDGVAERLVDDEYANMIADLPRQQTLTRIAHLEAKGRLLQHDCAQPFPHRQPKRGSANVQERARNSAQVPTLYESQESLFAQIRKARWFDLPPDAYMPVLSRPREPPIFVIAHLFSGRRRCGDVHERLTFWAGRMGIQLLVLSLDTANSVTYGDLHHSSVTWGKLIQLYRDGRVAATLAGAPCETWSAARHHTLPPDECSGGRSGPRPLRDIRRLFGRKGLTMRELRQLQQGSLFFMQMATTVVWTLLTGGVYLSEHPAPSSHPDAASIWKTPWMELLCQHPLVKLHIVAQWRWGCTVHKPTGLLAVRLPRFIASMYSREMPNVQRPRDVAIGRGPDGRFRTSAHKEYPAQFCDALAGTIVDQIRTNLRNGHTYSRADIDPDLIQWAFDAANQCGQVRDNATWLPDYQDR